MNKTTHTPTPYYLTKTKEHIVIQSSKINEDNFVCYMQEPIKQDLINAKFIVKACNSHDELVEALKNIQKLVIGIDSTGLTLNHRNTLALIFQNTQKAGE